MGGLVGKTKAVSEYCIRIHQSIDVNIAELYWTLPSFVTARGDGAQLTGPGSSRLSSRAAAARTQSIITRENIQGLKCKINKHAGLGLLKFL